MLLFYTNPRIESSRTCLPRLSETKEDEICRLPAQIPRTVMEGRRIALIIFSASVLARKASGNQIDASGRGQTQQTCPGHAQS